MNISFTPRDIAFQTVFPHDGALNTTARLLEKPFNNDDVIVSSVLLIFFMVFGIVANLVTIGAIVSSDKLRSIFYSFILSLCVSDTLSALISWINLYRRTWGFDSFLLSNFICVLYRSFDVWTSFVTSLHILSFAVLRLIAVRWPLYMAKITTLHGQIWIALIWIVSFFSGAVPMMIFNGVRSKDRTSGNPYSKWPDCTQLPEWFTASHQFALIAYPIFFYIPIVCVVTVSIIIVTVMIERSRKIGAHISTASQEARRSSDKQAILQLLLIVTSFLLGYLPFTAFEFYTYNQYNDSASTRWVDWHFGTWQYICLRLSECLNPVFYNLSSRRMREATANYCRGLVSFRRRRKIETPTHHLKVKTIT